MKCDEMSEKYLAAIYLSGLLWKSFEYEYNEVTDSIMRRTENSSGETAL